MLVESELLHATFFIFFATATRTGIVSGHFRAYLTYGRPKYCLLFIFKFMSEITRSWLRLS